MPSGSREFAPHGAPARLLTRWTAAVERHPLLTCLAIAAATALVAVPAIGRLGVDTDTADMISERLPWRQSYLRYKEAFPQFVDQLLVVVDGATPDLADRARHRLAERLRAEPELFPEVYVPGGGAFFERHALLYLDTASLADLAEHLERGGPWIRRFESDPSLEGFLGTVEEMLRARRRGGAVPDMAPLLGAMAPAFAAPLAWGFYEISWQEVITGRRAENSDRRLVLLVRPRMEFRSLLPAREAMAHLRTAVAELGLVPERGVRVRLSGSVAMEHEELESVLAGASRAGWLALVMVTVVLWIGLRSVRTMLAATATLLVGLLWTAAFAAFAVGHLNLISVAFAVLYVGLGIDYAIHVCLRVREAAMDEGLSIRPALRVAAGDVGPSVALSAVTTAACFYAFVPTAFRGVSELGVISGTGMFISLFLTLTLLPALLVLLNPRLPNRRQSRFRGLSSAVERMEAWQRRRSRSVVVGALVAGVGGLFLVPGVRFDHNPLHLRDAETESVATFLDLLADSSSAPLTISILEPDSATAEATAARVARLPVVRETLTLTDFIPSGQDAKRRTIQRLAAALGAPPPPPPRAAARAAPDSILARLDRFLRELARFRAFAPADAAGAARWLGFQIRAWTARVRSVEPRERVHWIEELERSLVGSLPFRLERLRSGLAPGPVTVDSLPDELVARWVSALGPHRVEVLPRENVAETAALRRFVEEVRAEAPQATGGPVIELEAGKAVSAAFRSALLLALLATAGLLLAALRRRRDAFLALLPLLLAAVLTVDAAVLLGWPLNFANVIALPLLLGIGVDNGIHMVHRVRAAPTRERGLLGTSTARAVLLASLTTVFSFGNLAFSEHPGTASMGRLLTMGMVFVLLCTLVVLPALLGTAVPGERSGRDR